MCGIFGVINKDGSPVEESILVSGTRALSHRGPDGEGYLISGEVGLGHRRLSIVDLAGGQQPVSNEDGTVYVIQNGEIYNHQDLRNDLIRKGHVFRTQSDTEAIVHLYEEEGEQGLNRLRGMFALAIFDAPRKRLVLIRDRLGIKPLYVFETDRRLLFSSETQSFKYDPEFSRAIDPQSLGWFLSLHYIPSPKSIYSGVVKVPPATILTLEMRGVGSRTKSHTYWKPDDNPDPSLTEDQATEQIRELLDESVKLRLMADVPVGAFLSGGVDSSAVVATMNKVDDSPPATFTIGFKEKSFNESEAARLVSENVGSHHREEEVGIDATQDLPDLIGKLDEPLADPSLLATWQVARLARRHVKVCLSGDGGDELFSGYDRHGWASNLSRLDRWGGALLPVSWLARNFLPNGVRGKNRLGALPLPAIEQYLARLRYFNEAGLKRILAPDLLADIGSSETGLTEKFLGHDALVSHRDLATRLPALDLRTYLVDDVLTKVDRASMLNSLEVRVPLLDHRFVELALKIPHQLKRLGSRGKIIFRRAVSDRVPHEILSGKKRGFSVPIKRWLDGPFGEVVRGVLLDRTTRSRGFLQTSEVARILTKNDGRWRHFGSQIFGLFVLEMWLRGHLDQPVEASQEPVSPGDRLLLGEWFGRERAKTTGEDVRMGVHETQDTP